MREPFRNAHIYVTILLILEVCIGLLIIILTAIYHNILSRYLADMERKMLSCQFFNIYILGFQLIVAFLCSLTMWNRIWERRCTPNIQMLLAMWSFFCSLLIFCGFGTIWSLFQSATVMENSAEISLLRGIDMYYSCPEWKLLWDGLQLHKECCGVHGYRDWMKAEWMPRPNEGPMACSDNDTVLAPYACCKRNCANCFQNYIPRAGSNHPFPTLSIEQINTEGCLPVFSNVMWRLMYILLILVVIGMKLDIILCCLSKYIIHKQSSFDGGGCNAGFTDDAGRPLVVVKYPAHVRCITVGEEDFASDIQPPEFCNCEPEECCNCEN